MHNESSALPLGEWLLRPELLRPRETVIPHIATEGRATLFAGREKIGKTSIVAQAVARASRAQPFLECAIPDPIRTLWYSIDEAIGDTVRRFATLGAAPDGVIISAAPRTITETLAALHADVESFLNVGVVVVDNLSRVFAMSGVDPNSSRDVEPVVAKLVDFFHDKNIAGVLLYHTGKGGREYRGSTAIGATVDEILTLRRRGQSEEDDFDDLTCDDGRRLLVQDGRNLRGRVQLTHRDGIYALFEETTAPRDRILETLRDHGTVYGRAELAKQAGIRKQIGLKVIAELIGSGAISENGKTLKAGSIQFPQGGTAPEPTREPRSSIGSQISMVGVTETGTAQRTREVEHEGRTVRQVLRPTQHGDRWIEVGAA